MVFNQRLSSISIFSVFISAIAALCFYVLFYLPLELSLTEFYFIFLKINPWINTGILFLLILIFNLFDWQRVLGRKTGKTIFFLFFVISFVFYGYYRETKIEREYLPKVYSLNPPWVIQGMTFEIKGVNFGPSYRRGSITIEKMQFQVLEWSENKIVVETPVFSKQGKFNVFVVTEDGKKSNSRLIEVKDPIFLKGN